MVPMVVGTTNLHPMSARPVKASSTNNLVRVPTHVKYALSTYRRNVLKWLDEGRDGQYALIKGRKVIGVYPDVDTARRAGYERFGLTPFCTIVISKLRATLAGHVILGYDPRQDRLP